MPPSASKKRPLNRVLWLVVIAVFILHGLATWALLHLQMPDPKPTKPIPTAPIEIELITLPSSLADSESSANSESGATTDGQPATSSSTATANNITQSQQQQPSAQATGLSAQSTRSATPSATTATRPSTSRSQTEATNSQSTNALNKATATPTTTPKPTVTTQRATNPTTKPSATSVTDNTKSSTSTKLTSSAQAPSQAANSASQATAAATTKVETQTKIVAKPTTSTQATDSSVSNKSTSGKAATAQAAVAQDGLGQQGGQTVANTAQTTGASETNKGNGAGAENSSAKPDTAAISAVVTGPFVFAESEAQWRREPNLNSFKQNLFREHDEATIRVRVSIEVNEKGRPTKVQVESGPLKARLANQLKRDLLSGEFVPFTRGGRAVAGTVKLPLRFVRAG